MRTTVTGRRWRRGALAVVLTTVVVLGGCGGGADDAGGTSGGGGGTDGDTQVVPDDEGADDLDGGGTDGMDGTDGTDGTDEDAVAGPEGEVWQWALGRDLWSDPVFDTYTEHLGTDWGDPGTDVHVQSQGFSLTADDAGTVVAVTLYNDETALGLPASDSSFSAYAGDLPGGLTWADTASDLGVEYGAPGVSGGWGTTIVLDAETDDGYALSVTFLATHAEDLPGSPILNVVVR